MRRADVHHVVVAVLPQVLHLARRPRAQARTRATGCCSASRPAVARPALAAPVPARHSAGSSRPHRRPAPVAGAAPGRRERKLRGPLLHHVGAVVRQVGRARYSVTFQFGSSLSGSGSCPMLGASPSPSTAIDLSARTRSAPQSAAAASLTSARSGGRARARGCEDENQRAETERRERDATWRLLCSHLFTTPLELAHQEPSLFPPC
jgi:hypothetical protein